MQPNHTYVRRSRRPPGELVTRAHFDTALAQLESPRLAWRLVPAGIAMPAVVVAALRFPRVNLKAQSISELLTLQAALLEKLRARMHAENRATLAKNAAAFPHSAPPEGRAAQPRSSRSKTEPARPARASTRSEARRADLAAAGGGAPRPAGRPAGPDQVGLVVRKQAGGRAIPPQGVPKRECPRAKTPMNRGKNRLRRRAAPLPICRRA